MHVVIVILESLYISLLRNKGVIKVMGIRRCGLKKMEDFSINILFNNVKIKRLSLIEPTSCRDDLVSTAIVLFSNNSKYVFNVTSLMTVIMYCWHKKRERFAHCQKVCKRSSFSRSWFNKISLIISSFAATIASVSIFHLSHFAKTVNTD